MANKWKEHLHFSDIKVCAFFPYDIFSKNIYIILVL